MKTQSLVSEFHLELTTCVPLVASRLSFQHAMRIYINKPQVVNNWLAGSMRQPDADTPLGLYLASSHPHLDAAAFLVEHSLQAEAREFISKSASIFNNLTYVVLNDVDFARVLFLPILPSTSSTTTTTNKKKKYASITRCHLFEFDEDASSLRLYVDKRSLPQQSDGSSDRLELQINWLHEHLMSKLCTWCANVRVDETFSCAEPTTLTLYANMLDDYTRLYQELKSVYWPRFAPDWQALTNTSPEKFIHEDISIAAYLILAWRHVAPAPVRRFVDLGCGNGLLVHILNDQGYAGYGVDMRRRRIWTRMSEEEDAGSVLLERTIDPRADTFDDCDWLIANHSDELTPWMPIMAARAARRRQSPCHFVLIPCCLFDFEHKFEAAKKCSGESRYDVYIDYLTHICSSFGFRVRRDKLRIPSTRNVCLVCVQDEAAAAKSFEPICGADATLNVKLRRIFEETVAERATQTTATQTANSAEMIEFKARDLVAEKAKSTRNCTRNVHTDLRVAIVRRVLEHLLVDDQITDHNQHHSSNNNELEGDDDATSKTSEDSSRCRYLTKSDGGKWNAGRAVSLNNVAGLFDKSVLAKLKLECGGIKVR